MDWTRGGDRLWFGQTDRRMPFTEIRNCGERPALFLFIHLYVGLFVWSRGTEEDIMSLV